MSLNIRFLLLAGVLMLAACTVIWLSFTNLTERIIEQWGLQIAELQVRNDTARLVRPLSRDISMAREFAADPDLLAFALTPEDEALQERAFTIMEIYRRQFRDHNFFVALAENHAYFHNNATDDYADALLRYKLDPDNPDDRWFFALLEQGRAFHLNVNPDVHLNVTKLWIDVLIGPQANPLGVVGTGLELETVLGEIVDINQPGISTLFVDRNGAIQLHRKLDMIEYASFIKPEGQKNTIEQLLDRPDQAGQITALMDELYHEQAGPERIETAFVSVDGQRNLLGMAYLPSIGWYQMTLLDLDEIIPLKHFWPVVLAFVLVLLISLAIFHLVLRAILLNPLASLGQAMDQVREGRFEDTHLPRAQGEIGQLTQHFSDMAESITRNTRELEEKVAERTEELHLQARQDSLTGLYNRRGLQELMEQQNQAAGPAGECGVLWLDLDEFKQVNDRYGHEQGDKALLAAAQWLRDCGVDGAHIARWGGDEFLVYIAMANETALRDYAECLINKAAASASDYHPSVSVGVALGWVGEPVDRLLARADKALYQAKEGGRARYVFAGRG